MLFWVPVFISKDHLTTYWLTSTFKWIECIKYASFVHGMINLGPYYAIVTLSCWHLLLLVIGIRHLHHYWLSSKDSISVIRNRWGLLLLEDLWVWHLRTNTHGCWHSSCNAVRILRAEYTFRYFDLAVSKLLHPVISSRLHCWLQGWRLLIVLWLIRHVLYRQIQLFYKHHTSKDNIDLPNSFEVTV